MDGETGEVLWSRHFASAAGLDEAALAVALDSQDNVFVTGRGAVAVSNDDMLTMKLAAGTGEVLCDGIWVPVKEGHVAFIPGNAEHQIRNAGDKPLMFICVIPSGPPEI